MSNDPYNKPNRGEAKYLRSLDLQLVDVHNQKRTFKMAVKAELCQFEKAPELVRQKAHEALDAMLDLALK